MKEHTPARSIAGHAHTSHAHMSHAPTGEPEFSAVQAPSSAEAAEHAEPERAAKHGALGHLSSDEELQQAVCNALIEAPEFDMSDVAVAAANAEITLVGSVATPQDLALAERIAAGQAGVQRVHTEELRVRQA